MVWFNYVEVRKTYYKHDKIETNKSLTDSPFDLKHHREFYYSIKSNWSHVFKVYTGSYNEQNSRNINQETFKSYERSTLISLILLSVS